MQETFLFQQIRKYQVKVWSDRSQTSIGILSVSLIFETEELVNHVSSV